MPAPFQRFLHTASEGDRPQCSELFLPLFDVAEIDIHFGIHSHGLGHGEPLSFQWIHSYHLYLIADQSSSSATNETPSKPNPSIRVFRLSRLMSALYFLDVPLG